MELPEREFCASRKNKRRKFSEGGAKTPREIPRSAVDDVQKYGRPTRVAAIAKRRQAGGATPLRRVTIIADGYQAVAGRNS